MDFELYGYRLSGDGQPQPLREVTFCIDPAQARALSEFFAHCARAMDANPSWDHEHFAGGKTPEVIVACAKGTHNRA